MFNINKLIPTDIFQDTKANYPLENLSHLLLNHQNIQMTKEDRDWVFKNIVGLIMGKGKKVTRVVEVREDKLIITDKFTTLQGEPEEMTFTIETKDRKSLPCTISTISKKSYKYDVTVGGLNDFIAMSQLSCYMCDLSSDYPWSDKSRNLLHEITVTCLIMSRDFINSKSKATNIPYPESFGLFNQQNKQIVQLIKDDGDYTIERIFDTE